MASILGSEVHRLKADVAVIGGGTAGAEAGADVRIVDKAHIQRSGAISGGMIPKGETCIYALD